MNTPALTSPLSRDEILFALAALGEDPKMCRVDQVRERIDASTLPEGDREAAVRAAVDAARVQLDAGVPERIPPEIEWSGDGGFALAKVQGIKIGHITQVFGGTPVAVLYSSERKPGEGDVKHVGVGTFEQGKIRFAEMVRDAISTNTPSAVVSLLHRKLPETKAVASDSSVSEVRSDALSPDM